MQARNLRREEWVLANEALGAVDRVDQPPVLGIRMRLPGFLAIKPVTRKRLQNNLTDGLLAFDIGLRYRRSVFLGR